jgi:hypothetical protein
VKSLVVVVVLAGVAHAQPSLTAPMPRPQPVTADVELDATFGGTRSGDVYAGIIAGGAFRLSDWFWIHAAAGTAKAPVVHFAGIDQYEGTSDRFTDLRGGLELRTCTHSGLACGIFGVDFGGRHEVYSDNSGHMVTWSGTAVARAGLDIGAANLRARAMFEGTTAMQVGDTSALNLGVAYLW